MDFGEFVDVFGNVIERCPLIAAAVWSQRPFSGLEDLEKHFFAFIDALPPSGKASVSDTEVVYRGTPEGLVQVVGRGPVAFKIFKKYKLLDTL